MTRLTHPALEIVEDINFVVDVQLVGLHEAGGVGVGLLDFPHELPELSPRLTCSLADVLTDVNIAVPAQFPFPQNLLAIFEVFKSDQYRSGARDLRSYRYQMALFFYRVLLMTFSLFFMTLLFFLQVKQLNQPVQLLKAYHYTSL